MIQLPLSDEYRLVVCASAQRGADDAAVRLGTPNVVLMDGAGTAAARWMLANLRMERVTVLAGRGGNGGDGLVVARRLIETDIPVRTFVASPYERLSETARDMADRLLTVAPESSVSFAADLEFTAEAIDTSSHVVDALLGSGLNRPVDGKYRALVRAINGSDRPTISLDIPSGLPSDSGRSIGEAVRADVTLAMAFFKPAHLLYPAARSCGTVVPVDVPYPAEAIVSIDSMASVIGPVGAARRLPVRPPDGHKGTFGRVLIVAGSRGMLGAAVLCSRAALRAGAGLVTLAAPESLCGAAASAVPEALTLPLPEHDGHVAQTAVAVLSRSSADVCAIGPGLSRHEDVQAVVRETVAAFQGPIVVDADALFALHNDKAALRQAADRVILTPHSGEMGRLIGRSPGEVDENRLDVARTFIEDTGVVLLLKGRPTVIGCPNGPTWLNPTGNDGLATGGTGDVLTGLVAGLLANGASRLDAAILGAYIHGACADRYAGNVAARSLTAGDLVDRIPVVLKELEACD